MGAVNAFEIAASESAIGADGWISKTATRFWSGTSILTTPRPNLIPISIGSSSQIQATNFRLAIKCVHYSRVDQITQAFFGIFHHPVYTFGLNRYEIFYLLTHGSSANNFELITKLARLLRFFAVVFISMKVLAVAESSFHSPNILNDEIYRPWQPNV